MNSETISYEEMMQKIISTKDGTAVKEIRVKWVGWAILTVAAVLFSGVVFWLNTPQYGEVKTAAQKVMFAKAHVTEVISEDARPDTWTEGLRLGSQEVYLTLDSSGYKGAELYAINYLSAYGNMDLKAGTKVIVRLDTDESGNPFIVSISNYDRSTMLTGLVGLFILLLILLGGKKGLATIVGLLFTLFSIWYFLIPLLKRGVPAIPAAILLVAVTTFVSLGVLNGYSKKTFIAIIGCIGGVTVAGLIAYIAGRVTPLNGFNMSEAEELILRASDSGLTVSGLLVSGILIASLGAVMDVALMIASAVTELHEMNPHATRGMLFKSGLNIGRDAMGTMANTLILAFAGASLNMLVLFRVFDYPYLQLFNSDLMTIEIVQGMAGSMGIVLTVPLVAFLSAYLYGSVSQGTLKRAPLDNKTIQERKVRISSKRTV